MSRHEGRTAVIAGAARGLGREYARRLASENPLMAAAIYQRKT